MTGEKRGMHETLYFFNETQKLKAYITWLHADPLVWIVRSFVSLGSYEVPDVITSKGCENDC